MLLDILLQHPDIGKKQIAAETVNQNSLHRMDLAAFPQISKMLMPRLDSQKTSCRFWGTDDHFCKRQDNSDQNAVDRAKHQHTKKCTYKNETLGPADFPQSDRKFKLRRTKQCRNHDRRQHRNRQIPDKTGSTQKKNDHW